LPVFHYSLKITAIIHQCLFKQPHGDDSKTSFAPAVYPPLIAMIHARPIPGRHRAQTKCCRGAPLPPKTPAALCLYPFAFRAGVTLLICPEKSGSTICLCVSCCGSTPPEPLRSAC